MAGEARSPADELARWCSEAHAEMARSARLLHDEAGPLLSAAGLRLELLARDHPGAAADLKEVLALLEGAMDQVRQASQWLRPSPAARSGLKQALAGLARSRQGVTLSWASPAKLAPDTAAHLYDAAAAAIQAAADAGATAIRVGVSGSAPLRICISDNGRKIGRARALAAAALLARASGLAMDVSTKKDTIVQIRYGLRRSAGR